VLGGRGQLLVARDYQVGVEFALANDREQGEQHEDR
jgi:hypothetical protein